MTVQPWQKEMLNNVYGGIKKGELMTIFAGRQAGKSQIQAYMRMWNDIHHSGPVEDLKLSTGTVYGARYHTVEPVGGNWREMEAWCYQTFGNAGDKLWGEPKAPEPAQRWYMNNRKFWFRSEQDQLVFVMRWR